MCVFTKKLSKLKQPEPMNEQKVYAILRHSQSINIYFRKCILEYLNF